MNPLAEEIRQNTHLKTFPPASLLKYIFCFALIFGAIYTFPENKVLGELVFEGATKTDRDAGVWVDGQYLGYVKELKGSKKVLLLPGDHEVVIREDGYKDFTEKVTLQPAQQQVVHVALERDPQFQMPSMTAEIKLSVDPDRAAVFVDGLLAGHAGELGGVGRSLVVAPGKRKITISLPGYQTFETEVELSPHQKFTLKTKLLKEGSPAPAATTPAP